MAEKNYNIVFMGTPEFAVESLKILVENKLKIVGVVTAPDKPSGRGLKVIPSSVKTYALQNNLKIFQPEKLKDELFIHEIKSLNPDLFVVVAFRMLPEILWKIPKCGTFNLHASLLPDYRGAAPINHAIINGENKTGVTTFFIDEQIDTGKIIMQEEVSIEPDENAGSLHDKLMFVGAQLVLKTINAIISGDYSVQTQDELLSGCQLKFAPKISKEDCKINWLKNIHDIYNHIRGLSPYPCAYTELISNDKKIQLKIFNAEKEEQKHNLALGQIISDNKNYLKIAVNQGFIVLTKLQQAGKSKMDIGDFLRGFKNIELYKLILQ